MNKLKNIIAVLFSVVLTILIFILLIICIVSHFFKTESIENTVKKIDLVHEMAKIQNSSAGGSSAEISDIITMAYKEADSHNIPETLVDEIFDSTEVKSFLGTIAGGTTDYIINGKKTKTVTSDDFNELLDKNIDKWISNSNTEISDSKKEVLLVRMKSAAKGVIDNLPNQDNLNQKISSNTQKTIKQIFSIQTKIILTIVILIITIIIIIMKKLKSIPHLTIPLILSSIGLISLSLILTDIITEVLTNYNLSFIAAIISDGLSHNMLLVGIIILIISAVITTIYYKKTAD